MSLRHHAPKPNATLFAAMLLGIFLSLFAVLYTPGDITGAVVYEPQADIVETGGDFNDNTIHELNATNITGLKVSGTLSEGSATVWLQTGTERILVWEGETTTDTHSITTDKTSYALDSEVLVTVTPSESDYTLWLTDSDGGKELVQETFTTTTPGDYTLDALINDSGNISIASVELTIRNDTNSSNDVEREVEIEHLLFEDACVDTCELETTTGPLSLEIELSEEASIDLTAITVSKTRPNEAPTQTATIPDTNLEIGESVTLYLDDYFTDSDGDALTYDYMSVPGVDININGDELTLTGTAPGITQSVIYASDLYELTQSELFSITITGEVETQTNTTENETENITPPVEPPTEIIIPPSGELNCTNPDPNARPLGCLQEQEERYFKPQAILVEDLDRRTVARITPIGNLLLTGDIRENSAGSPPSRAFTVYRTTEFGENTAVAWSDDGDLHLTGQLHEEALGLLPPKGSYSIQNSQSITIAFIDRSTGDLYLRGNLIPYRRSLE